MPSIGCRWDAQPDMTEAGGIMGSTHQGTGASDRERNAFNIAFSELELCWHWDESTYAELSGLPTDGERLRTYLARQHGHLLKAYDAEFLVEAICATKSRTFQESLAA
jgi:hypothetical protein